MRILTASQMREADRFTIEEIGIPSLVLMENAGRQVVSAIESAFESRLNGRVAVLCGRGNNGGDGFVVARTLLQRGIDVKLPTAVRATAIQGERIFIDVPLTYRKDRVVYMANEPIRLDILQERMRQKMENQSEKQVYLRIEGALQVQDQMDVIDRLKAAGVQTVGIVAAAPKK